MDVFNKLKLKILFHIPFLLLVVYPRAVALALPFFYCI